MGGGGAGVGWGWARSGLIDNGRVYQSKAADALVQVKTTKFGTNVGLNMLLNISSRYFGGLLWSRQLRGLPSSDGYFYKIILICIYWLKRSLSISFVKHGSMHDRLYQAQNKFNRNNDNFKKYVLLFDVNQHVNLELWCWGEFVVECWSPIVICTPAYHSLCIVHAQWSPATFLGKGLIPLVHL